MAVWLRNIFNRNSQWKSDEEQAGRNANINLSGWNDKGICHDSPRIKGLADVELLMYRLLWG
jgi:hypothetical protein